MIMQATKNILKQIILPLIKDLIYLNESVVLRIF